MRIYRGRIWRAIGIEWKRCKWLIKLAVMGIENDRCQQFRHFFDNSELDCIEDSSARV